MATLAEMKHRDSIEIEVALPEFKCIECPLFSFMENEWIFRFIKEINNSTIYYSAYIVRNDKKSSAAFKPFKFSYRVEIVDGTNIKTLYEETYINLNDASYRFLKIPYRNFLDEKIPCNYTGWNVFKFSFTVYQPSEPVLKLKPNSQDKCVQTVSYLNADVFMKSLSKDLSGLFDSGLNHDVEIKCGEHTVKAHKNILCARSNVLKTMLHSDFLESRTGVIEIQDMDSSSFLDFIKYIYTDLLPELTPEKAMTLYETGDKYDMKSLSMQCSEYLQDNLSLDNVCRCLALADAHCDETLKSKAIAYILFEKLYLQNEYWTPFCESYPKVAIEVYNNIITEHLNL